MPMTLTATDETASQIFCDGVAVGTLTTTNATPTIGITIPTTTGQMHLIIFHAIARRSDSTDEGFSLIMSGTFKNNAGTVTTRGIPTEIARDADGGVACDAVFDVSSPNVRVSVTGEAAQTWQWKINVNYTRF